MTSCPLFSKRSIHSGIANLPGSKHPAIITYIPGKGWLCEIATLPLEEVDSGGKYHRPNSLNMGNLTYFSLLPINTNFYLLKKNLGKPLLSPLLKLNFSQHLFSPLPSFTHPFFWCVLHLACSNSSGDVLGGAGGWAHTCSEVLLFASYSFSSAPAWVLHRPPSLRGVSTLGCNNTGDLCAVLSALKQFLGLKTPMLQAWFL